LGDSQARRLKIRVNGEDGRSYNYLNEDLEQEKTVRAAVDGDNIMSTIDVTLQGIVEKAIADFQAKYANAVREGDGSYTTAAIMMDPNNGEVLAMASYPDYDLNDVRNPQCLLGSACLRRKRQKIWERKSVWTR